MFYYIRVELDLAGHGHIHEAVTDVDNHPSDDARIHLKMYGNRRYIKDRIFFSKLAIFSDGVMISAPIYTCGEYNLSPLAGSGI